MIAINISFTSVKLIKRKWESLNFVELCPTLWDAMGYTVHGIFQARILEWVTIKMHLIPCFKRLQRFYSKINLGVMPKHNCCHFSWAGPSCFSTQATLTRIEYAGDHWRLSFSESWGLDNWVSPAHSLQLSIRVAQGLPSGC